MQCIDRDILDDSEAIPALGHGDITNGAAIYLGDENLRVGPIKILRQFVPVETIRLPVWRIDRNIPPPVERLDELGADLERKITLRQSR